MSSLNVMKFNINNKSENKNRSNTLIELTGLSIEDCKSLLAIIKEELKILNKSKSFKVIKESVNIATHLKTMQINIIDINTSEIKEIILKLIGKVKKSAYFIKINHDTITINQR